jgi:hypothetical protein
MSSLQSIVAFKTYGISTSSLKDVMYNREHIPSYMIQSISLYKLLYWSAEYLIEQTEKCGGTIIRYDIPFQIVWNVPRGTVLAASKNNSMKQYRISFRKAMPEYNIPPICFISETTFADR